MNTGPHAPRMCMHGRGFHCGYCWPQPRAVALALVQNAEMASPTRFIKRIVSEQAPREAVVRQDIGTRRFLLTCYRYGVKQPDLARETLDEKEAVRWAREFVGAEHEAEG